MTFVSISSSNIHVQVYSVSYLLIILFILCYRYCFFLIFCPSAAVANTFPRLLDNKGILILIHCKKMLLELKLAGIRGFMPVKVCQLYTNST